MGNGDSGYGGPLVLFVTRMGVFLYLAIAPFDDRMHGLARPWSRARGNGCRVFQEPSMAAPSRRPGDATVDLLVLPSTVALITPGHQRAPGCRTEGLFECSGYLVLRDLTCIDREGVLSRRGRVPTYYLLQVAQEIASSVEGVRLVINAIDVDAPAKAELAHDHEARRPPQPSAGPGADSTSIRGEQSAPLAHEGSAQRCSS
jgi:hypothetical protein